MLHRDIAPLLEGRETTGGHLITGYVHKAISLKLLAIRVRPSIFGLRKVGSRNNADALEHEWTDWIARFNAIAEGCPR